MTPAREPGSGRRKDPSGRRARESGLRTGAIPEGATVLTEAQLHSLGSAVRREIFTTLGGIGPASVAEVATALGQPPDTLYYHVRNLARAGLVEDLGKRPAATRHESVYRVVGRLLISHPTTRSRSYLTALRKMWDSVLRLLGRRLGAALVDRATVRTGPGRELTFRTQLVRLDEVALVELNRRLDDLASFLGERSLSEGGELFQVVTATTVLRREGARRHAARGADRRDAERGADRGADRHGTD